MAESYISELGDSLSHGVANTNGDRVKIIAPKLYNDGNGNHPSIATALAGKVDVKNVNLDGQTTTILAQVQALAASKIHYKRFYTSSDGGSANISDKPTGTSNYGFMLEAYCNRYVGASDWRYVLLCYVTTGRPKIAWITQSTSSISWQDLNTNTDTLVKATAKTDNVNYKVLATASASPTSGNATEAVYDTDISLNPSTNTITANISGNAATATKPLSTLLTSSDDLNNVKADSHGDVRTYHWSSGNVPTNSVNTTSTGMMQVFRTHSNQYCVQMAYICDLGLYKRVLVNGTWGAWSKILAQADVTDTYSSSGTAPVSGKAVSSAISAIKQDGITGATVNRFGTCSTAAATAAKTVSITTGTFSLEAGSMVAVSFSNKNTANSPTLAVGSTAAKNIFVNGAQITSGSNKGMLAGTVIFIYDGTQYHLIGNYYDSNSTYSGFVCGYCSTAADTAAKEVSAKNYSASVGNTILVRFTNPNSAAGALTLNAGGVTKPIKWNGTVTASGATSAIPAGTWPCYYDGTYWNIWTNGAAQGNSFMGGLLPVGYIHAGAKQKTWACLGQFKRTGLAANTWGTITLMLAHGSGISGPNNKYNVDNYILTFQASAQDFSGKITLLNNTDNSSKTYVTLHTKYDSTTDAWILYASSATDKNYASYQIYEFPFKTSLDSFRYIADGGGFLDEAPTETTEVTGYISALFPKSITTNQVVLTDGTTGLLKTTETLAVGNGGTGMSTATNKNAVVIGNSTTVTDAMQTVRTASGAFYATAQDAKPQFGTLPIAQGGTGAPTRLNALKALTNESVGTNATYFLTITNSWGKGGYTSVSEAKSVLGISDVSNGNVGSGTTCYGVLVAEITVSTGVETAEYLATFFVDTNFGIKNYVKEVIDVKFIFRNSASTGNYAVWYARAEHRMSHDSSQMPVYFAYKTDANKASIYILWSSDGSATSGTWRIKVQSLSKLGCTSVAYPGTTLSEKLTGFSSFNEVYMVKTAYRSATGTTSKPVYVDAYGAIQPCDQYAGGTAVTLNNSSKAGSTASFYAPTAGGTANYVLIGNGTTSAPTWAEKAPKSVVTDYPAGFSSRQTSWTWGTLTTANGYTQVTDWHTSNGSDISFAEKSGAVSVQIDGKFYQNDGKNKVIDAADVSVPSTVPTLAWNTESTLATIDGKNIKVKLPASPDTDVKVTQTADDASTGTGFELLFSATGDNTTRTETSRKSSKLTYQPSTGTLKSTAYNVNSKCTLQFNTTTNALDFVFAW